VFPEDCRYTAEHEWVRPGADGRTVRIGITDYAQEALGDIVYVSLPQSGAVVTPGQSMGEVESTKSVSDIYAPVAGTVTACNDRLDTEPDLLNRDPYGEGWIVEVTLAEGVDLASLLDSAAYQALVESH